MLQLLEQRNTDDHPAKEIIKGFAESEIESAQDDHNLRRNTARIAEKRRKVDFDDLEILVLPDAYSDAEGVRLPFENGHFNGFEEEDCTEYPKCWSFSVYLNKCKEYKWLIASNGRLGCKVCRAVKNADEESKGMYVSLEWAMCLVSSSGHTKAQQLVSLRKKMFHHKNSNGHQKACAILRARNDETAPQFSVKKQVSAVFRTAYNIAKQGRPYTDLSLDVDLQTTNGCDLGRLLHSDHSCADIIDHISTEMRERLVRHMLQSKTKICILMDECNTYSKLKTLIICVRACFGKSCAPLTIFLDLVELPGTMAEVVLDKLLSCLGMYGFTEDYLKAHLIQLVIDGTSQLIGKESGVGTLLKQKYPQLVLWHCANHKLELLVGDVSKQVTGVNQLTVFFAKLYTTYHASPKNRWELGECAAELEGRLLGVGKIVDVSWVASSERSVRALWDGYTALSQHFWYSSTDPTRSDSERRKYARLLQIFTSTVFVANLGLLYDALTEIVDISGQLNRPGMTIYEADQLLYRQSYVFESRAAFLGPFSSAAAAALKVMEFEGVELHQSTTKGCIYIDRVQFFTSLAKRIRHSMTTPLRVCENTTRSPATMEYEELEVVMKLLEPDNWPQPLDISYGEAEVQAFCSRFHIPNTNEYISAFREYKQNRDGPTPEKLKQLTRVVELLTTSMSECECIVNVMNKVLTHLRSRMAVSRLSSLMFIKIVGPPVAEFRPDWYVQKWFEKGRRSADATQSMGRRPAIHDDTYRSVWDVL
ncbi:E3 SUMO-protein ligase KIAA1586-like [Ambystoma mexicanum]|uniref:E3 SUMO-protein ligase KIAA1586-like n=1 Tax=Ambystoma mexicanum TaxID=8296 RepID=UPI0037E7034F